MKILERGEWPKIEPPKIVICHRCNSKLEWTNADTKSGQYGETIIKCPVCSAYETV